MLRVTLENLGHVALSCQVIEGTETLNLGHVTMAMPTSGGNLSSFGKYLFR